MCLCVICTFRNTPRTRPRTKICYACKIRLLQSSGGRVKKKLFRFCISNFFSTGCFKMGCFRSKWKTFNTTCTYMYTSIPTLFMHARLDGVRDGRHYITYYIAVTIIIHGSQVRFIIIITVDRHNANPR